MDDKSYKSLLKAIRSSDVIDSFFKNYLISYVSGVKNGTRNNDFIDYEILKSIILKLANHSLLRPNLFFFFSCELSFICFKMRTAADSAPDSSEKLLQRGSDRKAIYMILVKGESNTIKHLLY